MEITLDDEKINSIVSAAAAELEAMLAKNAVDDSPGEQSPGATPPSDPDGDEAGEASPEGGEMGEAPEASAAPAPEGGEAPADPAADTGAPSVEELQAEYAQLPPDQLKMHYLAAKAALVQAMGSPDGGAPGGDVPPAPEASAPAPEASAPAPEASAAPPAASPPMPPMGKSENFATKALQDEVKRLSKALDEQKSLAKANDEALAKLTEIVAMPVRKSVKGLSDMKFVGRSAGDEAGEEKKPLTKSEVKSKLSTLIREGRLTKSDRELVAKYSVGAVDVSKIEHLLVNASK